MSVLVVGMSHKTAPLPLLERVALDGDGAAKLIREVSDLEHVTEATVLSTCNRTEVYADVDRFHGSVEEISRLLGERTGLDVDLVSHLYVLYEDGAVSHLFNVAAGLDSMVVGESQILGQAREALRAGQEAGTIGPALNVLFQQALRVGKRSHAETDIDRVAPSVVAAALERAERHVGTVAGKHVLVVGAGSMAGLTVATVSRAGAASVTVANRTPERAERLARQYAARAISLAELGSYDGPVDVLVSCTGAAGQVISAAALAERRTPASTPTAVLDLALPRDVDPAVAALPGVLLVSLETLAAELGEAPGATDVDGVREIVGQELAAFLTARRSRSVTPTVVALRTMATGVMQQELARLESRLPGLDATSRAEVEASLRRVVEKLLHQPTVRVKELANESGAISYAAALAELFALDPEAVQAVTRAEVERP
ncbi:glutamyl-tRNA reductase [Nocardioides marmoraquaticus]